VSSKDSIKQTLLVALCLCVACSILVSTAAVVLKPLQDANKAIDRNKNILIAAGLFDPAINNNEDVETLFAQFTPRFVDLDEGRFLSDEELIRLGINPATFDPRNAETDSRYARPLLREEDLANIKRRVRYQVVYTVETANSLDKIVVPINGYGLWGILYGFLALEGDVNTVAGIGFYELKETPGLGAEVTNPVWRSLWPGKKIYASDGSVALAVVRGRGTGESEIDGIAGSTLTSRGVENLIRYWLGDDGFGPFLKNLAGS
jgi:Na+-transporting NADH:ubiquinone oxidoreductase subunit C